MFYPGPPIGLWNVEGEEVNNLLRLIGRRLVALPIMALGVFYPSPPQGFWNVEGEEGNNLLRLIGRRLVALPIMALGVTLLVFGLMSFTDPSIKGFGM